MGGGLYDPLGTDPPAQPSAFPFLPIVVLGVVLGGLAALFAVSAWREDAHGGEPQAVTRIEYPTAADPGAGPSRAVATTSGPAPAPVGRADTAAVGADQEVEIQHGVRIVRPRTGAGGRSLTLKIPDPVSPSAAAGDRLSEPGPSGPLPKIAADGTSPAAAYAAAVPPEAAGRPWVALLVGSMGRDPDVTQQASNGWPATVTFGFAADGPDLPRQAAAARAAGHEIVLVLPAPAVGATRPAASMAGGTGAPGAENRLDWLMSRFTGYAGVAGDLGSRNPAGFAPMRGEFARRGLYVLDDGALSPGLPSNAGDGSPPIRADVLLDGSDEAASDRALEQLARLARLNGSAIGVMPTPPASLASVSRLAARLTDKGTPLVPLSAVMDLRESAARRPVSTVAP